MLTRRLLLASALTPAIAHAESWPSKPIRVVVGVSAGGSADFAARLIAQAIAPKLGQNVVVENRTGAVGAIAFEYVAKSPPDGYTLAFAASAGLPMLAAVKPNLPYNIATDFTYVSRVIQFDWVLNLRTDLPAKTLPELVTYARANPGKLRFGTIGVGSATHLATLLLEQQAGINVVCVPYRGGEALLPDLLGGRLDGAFLTPQDSRDHPDKMRAIAITATAREALLPDVPTMTESGYAGASMTMWLGLLGPAKLPAEIRDRLAAAVGEALDDPTVRERFTQLAFRPAPLVGDAFRKLSLDEYAQWQKVVQAAHVTID